MTITTKIQFKWESMGDNTSARAKVIGGWIIHCLTYFNEQVATSAIFIPDPNHEWEIEK